MHRLKSTLNIQPGEGRLVGLMLVYALFIGIPGLTIETTAYTLFLVEFDAQAIPYIYIGFALATALSGFIYTELEKRFSFSKFITLNLLLLLLSTCLFRFLLALTQVKWLAMALVVWYEASWALANLGFWSLAVHLFNIRQGKRLFALIGTGLPLAEVMIGFFIPLLVRWIGTLNLLSVAAISFGGALVVQSYILRSFANPLSDPGQEDSERQSRKSIVDLFENHYIVLIVALAILSSLAFYVLDNIFYHQLEALYPNPDQLASFIGFFFGLTSLLTMIMGSFISGQLISRYGLWLGLLVMPVIVIAGVGLMIMAGTIFEALVTFALLVIITKLFNEIFDNTINTAAWQVLYKPLPANQRLQVQTVVESMVKPMAVGLAGIILLVLSNLFAFEATQLSYVLFFILAVWIGIAVMLNRTYPVMLLQTLTKRNSRDASPFSPNRSREDDKSNVQRAALIATGKLKHSEAWSVVIESLALPTKCAAAVAALVAGGESVLPELEAAFAKTDQNLEILIRLPQICGQIGGPKAIALLKESVDFPDEQVRCYVLKALSQCGYRARDKESLVIREQIRAEAAQATWTLATLVDLGNDEIVLPLKAALKNNLARHRSRLFLLLSFIYDAHLISQVWGTLSMAYPPFSKVLEQEQAYALEIIDVVVSTELKAMLMPLLEKLTPAQRLQRLQTNFPQQRLSCQQRLEEIITGPNRWLNPWVKTCALYTMSQLSTCELSELIEEMILLKSSDLFSEVSEEVLTHIYYY